MKYSSAVGLVACAIIMTACSRTAATEKTAVAPTLAASGPIELMHPESKGKDWGGSVAFDLSDGKQYQFTCPKGFLPYYQNLSTSEGKWWASFGCRGRNAPGQMDTDFMPPGSGPKD